MMIFFFNITSSFVETQIVQTDSKRDVFIPFLENGTVLIMWSQCSSTQKKKENLFNGYVLKQKIMIYE